jgi:hypothetical protein
MHLICKKIDIKWVVGSIAIFIGLVIMLVVLELIHYECPIHHYLHIYCPGCGSTRMIIALLHLDIYQAFRYNPFMFILFILIGLYGVFAFIYYLKKKVLILPGKYIGIIIVILAFTFMVLRNISTFSYLIPTEL